MRARMIIGILFIMAAANASARPILYPGGISAMQMNDEHSHALHLNYTPASNYSIGYRSEYWHDQEWWFHGAELNYLVKRWNNPGSQANIYLKSAAGLADQESGEQEPGVMTGFAADWENRRYLTSYESRLVYAGDIDHFLMQKARVGMAPYIGDYGDLHSWLMLEVTHMPAAEGNVTFTPMVRLFKGDILAEAGISHRGDLMINWMVQF